MCHIMLYKLYSTTDHLVDRNGPQFEKHCSINNSGRTLRHEVCFREATGI
jgi:hypothetical protein